MFVITEISEIIYTGKGLFLKKHSEHIECHNFFEIN